MALVHGRHTEFELGGVELSDYCNNSQLELSTDTHDTTTYGKGSHVFEAGLGDGTLTVSGFYDSTTMTGPRAVILPLLKTKTTFTHRPEGTGGGRPEDAGDCIVTKYTQTHPVADMVTWSIDLQLSDDVSHTTQSS